MLTFKICSKLQLNQAELMILVIDSLFFVRRLQPSSGVFGCHHSSFCLLLAGLKVVGLCRPGSGQAGDL